MNTEMVVLPAFCGMISFVIWAVVNAWQRRDRFRFVSEFNSRLLDRLVIHPHRTLHRRITKLRGQNGTNGYKPGALACRWERMWDAIDARIGPYLAINVAVAFRKLAPGADPAAFVSK